MDKNMAINCNVTNCKHISSDGCHCSLESVNIGTHEANPQVCECVDCKSFCKKCSC